MQLECMINFVANWQLHCASLCFAMWNRSLLTFTSLDNIVYIQIWWQTSAITIIPRAWLSNRPNDHNSEYRSVNCSSTILLSLD